MLMTMNQNAFTGSTMNMTNVPGMAPMNGPTIGMTFVTPTSTLTRGVYGILQIAQTMNMMIPMISESRSFPVIYPPKVLSVKFASSRVLL